MVRERKHHTGASNLQSARSEHSNNPSVSSSTDKSSFTRAWAHTMIAPDEYKQKELEETKRGLKLSATWKPKEIYERNFETVHSASYTDFKNVRKNHGLQPKTLEEIAADNARVKQRQAAVDNMCHLVRGAYGTVATMLRSFHKKPSDNVTLSEFEKYLKRNDLDTYLGEEERRLVFDYVDERHTGEVPVRDFLKKVEEREFYGREHNKEHTKLKDFLEFHIKQQRSQQQGDATDTNNESGPTLKQSVSSPERTRLEELKKKKGLENEVELMKHALGMRTFGLDVELEELDHIVEEVFHKPPTNESHRKYARFLHHSQLNLAAIPFYDFRSREIDRLKSRSALIDEALTREGLKEEYDTLKNTMLRGSLAVSQSLPMLPTLRSGSGTTSNANLYTINEHATSSSSNSNNNSSSNYVNNNGVLTVRPSPLANTSTPIRPLTAAQLAEIESGLDDSQHLQPPPSPSSHGTFQTTKANPPRLEALTAKAHDTSLSSSQSMPTLTATMSPNKNGTKFNKRDWVKEHATKQKSMVVSDNVDHHISKGKEFDDSSVASNSVMGGGGNRSVGKNSYLDLLIEQPPPSDDGEAEFLAMLANGSPPPNKVKHTTASSQKNSLSKLMNRSQATQDHVSDFYTEVIHPSQSMGRSKDPTKVMRIEKTDITHSMNHPGGNLGGKKTFADKLASQDASRVGLGVNVRYYDASSDMNQLQSGGSLEQGHNNSMMLSASMGHLSPLRESSTYSSFNNTSGHPSSSNSWEADDVYRSVASMQYPPLIYEPSQPVRREAPSLATQEAAKREYRRKERYARKQANMEVTQNRIAYQKLNAELTELHRTQSRIEDAIRYKSSIFLGDLQSFRQQPLQRMAKRQNMDLSEKMWSGNLDRQTVGLVKDNREFTSTYRSDFDSEKLRHSDTLKGPLAQQLATMAAHNSTNDQKSVANSSLASGFVSQDTHSGFQ